MSFVHLLALTIAQDRADKVKENSLSSRSNKRIARSGSRRTLITVLYCGCFFSFGTTMAILGPTLMELGHRVHHGLDMMSWLFFTQASYATWSEYSWNLIGQVRHKTLKSITMNYTANGCISFWCLVAFIYLSRVKLTKISICHHFVNDHITSFWKKSPFPVIFRYTSNSCRAVF